MNTNDSDDELFRETHYARYGYDRTNIYGLAVLDSRKPTCLDRADEFPSHRFESFPLTTQKTPEPLKTPVRHLIAASSSEMVGMASRDGYWNSLHMALGLTMGRHEMIAMDAVEEGDRILVAVAIAEKEPNDTFQYSLRIFSSTAPYLEQALIDIADTRQVIPLSSAPMHLTHTWSKEHHQLMFLLTALDGRIHMYMAQDDNIFNQVEDVGSYYPMMAEICEHRLKILFMHIYDRPNGQQVICAGGQNGDVILGIYDQDGNQVAYHTTRVFSPITSVLVFQQRVSNTVHPEDELHIVVTCAIELAIVYRSIENNGLSKSRVLPQSGNYDSVMCSHAMDVDWDGEREIMIGTYGRQVLIYKQVAGTQEYNVLWRRQFAYPIYRISHLDLNRDGLDELIVSTMYGVHVFQPNMKRARERLLEVLQYVEGNKRRIYELVLEWRHQKEMEKAIVFESQ
ncbi:hypothetical protein LRAMOSA06191 [Lichtheimia ramosa]|uniref:Kaptin n=1 Tax=Lichtheimia ramosa TaxID=688394 RepID=A0A077X383_9FUNG|nr:hypothetical protein LRAMOSA06191 [Lichtheimia ramosa]